MSGNKVSIIYILNILYRKNLQTKQNIDINQFRVSTFAIIYVSASFTINGGKNASCINVFALL